LCGTPTRLAPWQPAKHPILRTAQHSAHSATRWSGVDTEAHGRLTSKIVTTACAISGPIPSPGNMVARNLEGAAAADEASRAPCTIVRILLLLSDPRSFKTAMGAGHVVHTPSQQRHRLEQHEQTWRTFCRSIIKRLRARLQSVYCTQKLL
jgi:hypothetical protein